MDIWLLSCKDNLLDIERNLEMDNNERGYFLFKFIFILESEFLLLIFIMILWFKHILFGYKTYNKIGYDLKCFILSPQTILCSQYPNTELKLSHESQSFYHSRKRLQIMQRPDWSRSPKLQRWTLHLTTPQLIYLGLKQFWCICIVENW